MRRPPVACRRAVQSLQSPAPQHIWISDELLSVALNRLFPTTCPHQKRHGSHVPGPLEARRRAAKRRMTVSTSFHPQDSFPPAFSLGALFGFRKDSPPLWRYEPPSLPQRREPLDFLPEVSSPLYQLAQTPHAESTAPTTSFPYQTSPPSSQDTARTFVKAQKSAFESSIASVGSTVEPSATVPSQTIDVDVEVCFANFKSRIAHAGDLSEPDRSDLIRRAFRLCCPSQRPTHPQAWVYNVTVIKHLTELDWDPATLIGRKASLTIPPTYTTESLELLRCVEQLLTRFPGRIQYFHRLNVKLAEAAVQAGTSASSTQDTELLLLIQQLWRSACLQSASVERSAKVLLYDVARKIQNRYAAQLLQTIFADAVVMKHGISLLNTRASQSQARYFAAESILPCIPRQHLLSLLPSITMDLAKAIKSKTRKSRSTYQKRFRTWLKLLHHFDSVSAFDQPSVSLVNSAIATIATHAFADRMSVQIRRDTLLHALIFNLSQQDAAYAALSERLLQLIDFSAESTQASGGSGPLEDWFGELFLQMQKGSLPYDNLAKTIATLLVQHGDLFPVLRFLTAIDKQGLKIRDTSALNRLVVEKMDFLQHPASSSTERERQRNAFALTTCQRILKLLSRITLSAAVSPLATKTHELNALQSQRQFQQIFDRAKAAYVLPLAYDNVTADVPLEQRIVLIHQLAHQYSLDNTRSHRQVWRSMYYLYCYLQHNSLPIGPLFTKAVVRVSIIRPLSEDRFVSARRLIWVCQLVARVEGEDVAKKIESVFWHWRGDLMRHAKSVYVSVGGDTKGKAHLGTMKKLGLI